MTDDLPKTRANYAPLTPITFIRHSASVFPDKPAIVHGRFRQSWGQTYARCRRLASALTRAGVARGDVVAVVAPNTPAMVEAAFGVPMAGAVLNTINTRLDADTVAFMLRHGEAKVVLVDREFAPLVKQAVAEAGTGPLVVDIEDSLAPPNPPAGSLDYEAFLAGGDPEFQPLMPQDE